MISNASSNGRGHRSLGSRLRHAGAVIVFTLLVTWFGCESRDRTSLSSIANPPTQATIDSLRMNGSYGAALELARARERTLRLDDSTPSWQYEEARRHVTALRRIAAAPESTQIASARADRMDGQADSLLEIGDLPGARALIEEQLATRQRILSRHDPEIATSLHALALICRNEGNQWRAFDLDREALAMRRRAFGPKHPLIAESLDALGLDSKGVGKQPEALELCREAVAMQRELLGPGSPEEMSYLVSVANMFRVMHQPDSALVVFRQVLDHHRDTLPLDTRSIGRILFGMAMTLTAEGRWSEAEPFLREATQTQRDLGAREQLTLGRTLAAHGSALRHLGRAAEAESVLIEATQMWERLRACAAPGPIRSVVYSLTSYGMLAAAQLERGHDQAAWLSTERPLARSLVEDLVSKGAIDTTGWWKDPLPRVQAALDEDEAIIGWLALRPGAAKEEYPFWCYSIRKHGPVHWARVDRKDGDTAASDVALDESALELKRASNWPLRMTDVTSVRALGRAAHRGRFEPLESTLDGVRHLVVITPDLNHGSPLASWVDAENRWLFDRFEITYAPSALLYTNMVNSAATRPRPSEWRPLLVVGPGLDSSPARGSADPTPSGVARADFSTGSEIRVIASLMNDPTLLHDESASPDRLRELGSSGDLAHYNLIHLAAHTVVDRMWLGRSALVLANGDSSPAQRNHRSTQPTEPETQLAMSDIVNSWRLNTDLVTLAACHSVEGPASSNDGYLGLPYAFLNAGARNVMATLWPVDDHATSLLMRRFYEILMDADEAPMNGEEARESIELDSIADRPPRDSAESAEQAVSSLYGSGLERSPRTPDRVWRSREVANALREASLWLRDWRAEDGSTPYAHPTYWAGFVLLCGGCAATQNSPALSVVAGPPDGPPRTIE